MIPLKKTHQTDGNNRAKLNPCVHEKSSKGFKQKEITFLTKWFFKKNPIKLMVTIRQNWIHVYTRNPVRFLENHTKGCLTNSENQTYILLSHITFSRDRDKNCTLQKWFAMLSPNLQPMINIEKWGNGKKINKTCDSWPLILSLSSTRLKLRVIWLLSPVLSK